MAGRDPNPTLFAQYGNFFYVNEVKQSCIACIDYDSNNVGVAPATRDEDIELNGARWDELAQKLEAQPKDGYCIVFIPAAPDITGLGDSPVPRPFTTIPISIRNWMRILPSLRIPKNYANVINRGVSSLVSISRPLLPSNGTLLQMSIGTIKTSNAIKGLAFASTYFEDREFTSAIIIGCSKVQIEKAKELLRSSKESRKHPLLMLSIFVELGFKQLQESMTSREGEYGEFLNTVTTESENLIETCLKTLDHLQIAQQEVAIFKRQLVNICIPKVEKTKAPSDFLNQFSESLKDMVDRLDGFNARCQQLTDNVLYRTELSRSETAREEAKSSAKNTRLATTIGFVALFYLPITGVATILAMPIFGWTNDWKNLHLKSIEANGQSNGSSADTGSAGATGTGLPVVSGYIWIWVAGSFGLLIITLIPFMWALDAWSDVIAFFKKTKIQNLVVDFSARMMRKIMEIMWMIGMMRASARSSNGRNLGGSGTSSSQVPSGVP